MSWATSAATRRTMLGNRGRDTKPELALRSLLHRAGLRFRVSLSVPLGDGRVRPDIAFPRQRIAVFVDGCFWHGCPLHGTSPRQNSAYWLPKLEANRARDERQTAELDRAGWLVVRVWEHEDAIDAAQRIVGAVQIRRR